MTATTTIPGYLVGTWKTDKVHSHVGFSARHLMVSKVRGSFSAFDATIVTAEDPKDSTVTAEIDTTSFSTGTEGRDNDIRSAKYLDVETYPTMTYKSTAVQANGDDWTIQGDLTLHGVTKSVPLKLEVNGFGPDPYGNTRAGFSATAEISRSEFGIDLPTTMEAGGVIISDKISINLEIEAILQKD